MQKPYQLISTGTSKYIPTDISTGINKKYDNDFLYEDLADLVNDQYRAWYCQSFYKLGKDLSLRLASTARADGKNPRNLFSYLLKKELNKQTEQG